MKRPVYGATMILSGAQAVRGCLHLPVEWAFPALTLCLLFLGTGTNLAIAGGDSPLLKP